MIKEGESAIDTLDSFQALLSYYPACFVLPPTERIFITLSVLPRKYRMMEAALRTKKTRYDASIAEVKASLEAVKTLGCTPAELSYDFELGSTLYAKVLIPPAGPKRRIGLWLGGGVMLEFEPEEAIGFLQDKLEERRQELAKVEHDLAFIRRQITTMEVNIARLYNYNRSSQRTN